MVFGRLVVGWCCMGKVFEVWGSAVGMVYFGTFGVVFGLRGQRVQFLFGFCAETTNEKETSDIKRRKIRTFANISTRISIALLFGVKNYSKKTLMYSNEFEYIKVLFCEIFQRKGRMIL